MNDPDMAAPQAAVRERKPARPIAPAALAALAAPAALAALAAPAALAALLIWVLAACDEPHAPMPAPVADGGSPGIEIVYAPYIRARPGTSEGHAASVVRKGGLGGAVTVSAYGLPDGVHIDTISLADAETNAFFFVDIDSNAAPGGPFAFTLVARSVEHPDVRFELPVDLYVAGAPGTDDVSFGLGGWSTAMLAPERNVSLWDTLVDRRGRVVMAGSLGEPSTPVGFVVRLDARGNPDASFAGTTNGFGVPQAACDDIMRWHDDTVLAQCASYGVGAAKQYLVRLDHDGAVDRSFGADGQLALTRKYTRVLPLDDGLLEISEQGLRVFRRDGAEETSLALPVPVALGSPWARTVDSQGRILLGSGGTSGVFRIARLTKQRDANGVTVLRLDPEFGEAGVLQISSGANQHPYVHRLVTAPDGSGVALLDSIAPGQNSYYDGEPTLLAFTAKGQLDTRFGDRGTVRVRLHGEGDGLLRQTDGSLIVTYTEGTSIGELEFRIARYGAGGRLDESFAATRARLESERFPHRVAFEERAGRLLLFYSYYGVEESIRIHRIWL